MTFEEWRYIREIERGNEGIDTSIKAIKNLAEQSWEAARPEWKPIETAPKDGSFVLLSYINYYFEKRRIIKAAYINSFTIEAVEEDIDSGFCEYCEDSDEHYIPEGWYEVCHGSDTHLYVTLEDGDKTNITHWMPLPEPPKEV